MYGSTTQQRQSVSSADGAAGPTTSDMSASVATKSMIKRNRQPQEVSLANFLRSLGMQRLGMLLVFSGLFFHVTMDICLLASYCNEHGCMKPGCTAWKPNQCLPSYSNTLMLSDGGATAQLRHYGMFVICGVVYSFFEPFLFLVAHRLLMESGASGINRAACFELAVVCAALLHMVSTALPNQSATEDMHQYFSCALILVWLWCIVPILATSLASKPEVPRVGIMLIWVLWTCAALATLWLTISWHWLSWVWYATEWFEIVIHGLVIALLGAIFSTVQGTQKDVIVACTAACSAP